METVRNCHLHQHILEPTRGMGCNTPSCIDIIFTNEDGMIRDIKESPLGKSDHSVVRFQFNTYITSNDNLKTRYEYDKGDYISMKICLNINYDGYLKTMI